VIHGCAWVEEIDGGGVREVANAVVHSVINIPAGSLKLVSASETHQGSFIHGHAAQACTLWNVRKRPCAIASALNLRFPKLNWVFAIECGSYGRLSPGLRDDLLVIQSVNVIIQLRQRDIPSGSLQLIIPFAWREILVVLIEQFLTGLDILHSPELQDTLLIMHILH